MLGFFRRFQKYVFAIVTVLLVLSFLFFGGTGSLFEKDEVVDRQVGVLVDGTKLTERRLEGMIRILENGLEEGTRTPNLLSDSFVHREIILSGLGKILAEHVMEELQEELEQRLDRVHNYVPYQHPYVPHISAKHIWTQFSPSILSAIEKIQSTPKGFTKEHLAHFFDCYVAQAAFPPPMLHQMLHMRQQQTENIRPDPGLGGANVALFGFQTIEDWFGRKFVEELATFLFNAARIAQKEGYGVSMEEARASLFANVSQGMRAFTNGNVPEMEEVEQVYAMQIRQAGLSEEEAVEIWAQVLSFDRMLKEVGESVFLDTLALDQFKQFAKEGASVIQYRLPVCLQLDSFRQMLKFQRYKEIVSETDLLGLPEPLKDPQEVMDLHPDLVYKRFDVEMARLEKSALVSRVSLKQTWNWEQEADHFALLQETFSFLQDKEAKTIEERMERLDSLSPQLRLAVDQFARGALVDAHPEWMEEMLAQQEMDTVTLKVRLHEENNPLSGAHFLALVEAEDPQLNCYTQDGHTFFSIKVLEKHTGWELLSFEEADHLMEEKLDQMLELAYESDPLDRPFEEVKDEVGAKVYADLLGAIEGDYENLDSYAQNRFVPYLEKMRALAMEDPDQFALAQAGPFGLISFSETLSLNGETLQEGEFAPVEPDGFFQLIEQSKPVASQEEIAHAKELLAKEAREKLMHNLIEKL